jgi:hypothetical protein
MRLYNIPISATPITVSGQPAPIIPMNADFTSTAYQTYDLYGYSIQVEFVGTPTGTFYLECSNDPVPQGPNSSPETGYMPTNWTIVADSSEQVVAAGDITWNVFDVMYTWVRLVYIDGSSGTSTATFKGRLNGKAP